MNCSGCGASLLVSDARCPVCGIPTPRVTAPKRTSAGALAAILAGVFVFALVTGAGGLYALKQFRRPSDPIARQTTVLLDERFPALKTRIRELTREGGDVTSKTRELSAQGLVRLPDQTLEERAVLMGRVLELLNPQECAALGRGQITGETMQRVLYAMSEEERGRFLAFSLEAADAEVRHLPVHDLSDEEIRTAFGVLHQSLAEGERDRFVRAMTQPQAVNDADMCWMTKRLYAQIVDLKDEHVRAVLARAVVMR